MKTEMVWQFFFVKFPRIKFHEAVTSHSWVLCVRTDGRTGQEAVHRVGSAAVKERWKATNHINCVWIIRSTLYLDWTVGGIIYRYRHDLLQSALPKSKNISFSWQHSCLGVCALNTWEGILSYQLFICLKWVLIPFLILEIKEKDSPLLVT